MYVWNDVWWIVADRIGFIKTDYLTPLSNLRLVNSPTWTHARTRARMHMRVDAPPFRFFRDRCQNFLTNITSQTQSACDIKYMLTEIWPLAKSEVTHVSVSVFFVFWWAFLVFLEHGGPFLRSHDGSRRWKRTSCTEFDAHKTIRTIWHITHEFCNFWLVILF